MARPKRSTRRPWRPPGRAGAFRILLPAVLLPALLVTGCANTVIDARKAREAVRDDVERKTGVAVRSVSCPTDVEVFPGETFSCRVVARDGRVAEVELRIRNFEADVETVSIERAPS